LRDAVTNLVRAAFAVLIGACALVGTAPVADAHGRDPAGDEATDVKYPKETIVGEWLTEGKDAHIRFSLAPDGTYMGVITWSTTPERKDEHNKDPKLRDRLIIGIVLMWHLRYDDGEYVDGSVYDPENGDTFRMKATVLGPDSLKIRGYLGISLFGQSQVWTRVH
jgi:uncharacterized protein (DUF2147 family)